MEKRSPVKAQQYRIKQQTPASSIKTKDTRTVSKSVPPGQLKPHQRYAVSDAKASKHSLLNTLIEEHLLKFGLVSTFDTFIKEAAEILSSGIAAKEKPTTPQELKGKLIDVSLINPSASAEATTEAS